MSDLLNFNNWSTYSLTDLANYHNGFAFKPKDWAEDGVKIIRIEQLNKPNGGYDRYAGKYPSVNQISDGDLIFSWSATLKVAIWNHGSAVLNQHLFRVDKKDGFEKQYIYYILDHHMDSLAGGSHGSTMKHIKRGELQKYKVSIPSLGYQKKIAKILSTIDRTITHTEALIEKYQQIKAGLMHDLFTRGIGADGKLRPTRDQAPELYQESSIGWIPKEWEVKPLGELCDIASGGTPSRRNSSFWNGSIPWIKTGEIKYNEIVKTEEYITQKGLDSSSAKIFNKGTVVMAIYGEGNTRGRVAMLGIDCASNQACVGFTLYDLVQSYFMYFFFENSYKALRDISNDGSQKNLSSSLLKQVNISFPVNKSEQSQIESHLLAIDNTLKKEKNVRDKLIQQKSGLMHDLLTGTVQVNIDPV
jgi:type I restriction enzyme, S subunit